MQGQSKRFIYDTSQRMHTPCQQRQKNLFVQRAFKENVGPRRNRVQVVRLAPQVAAVNLFDGERSKYLRAAMVLQKNTINKLLHSLHSGAYEGFKILHEAAKQLNARILLTR